jgi:hypothetical protein
MSILRDNAKEIAQAVICGAGALVTLWLGVSAGNTVTGTLLYAVSWAILASCAGYWIWAIFDNIEQARWRAQIERELIDAGAFGCFPQGYSVTHEPIPAWPKASQIEDEIRRNLNGEEAQ